MTHTVYVPVEELRRFAIQVFEYLGVPPDEAEIVANILITSDLWGIQSHGVGRLKMYVDRIQGGLQNAVTQLEIIRDTPTTAVIDGGLGMGHVIAYRSMELAIKKARHCGIGAVAVRNSTHFGIAGFYPLMAVKEGMVGLAVTNSRPSITPTFGSAPMLGTNPIAFGAPTDDDCPFLYDGATATVPVGKIEVLKRAGLEVPVGWAINQDGTPATDSARLLESLELGKAAMLPLGGIGEHMGGHKGYGLATMVEMLSTAFASGCFLTGVGGVGPNGQSKPWRLGHFFLAIDIKHFVALDDFKQTTGGIVRQLRASRRIPDQDRIYTAYEKQHHNAKRIRLEGIPVNPNLARDLSWVRDTLKLSNLDFGL